MRNKHYQPKKKQCSICKKCVDCAGAVKPFREIRGKQYHVACLTNKAAELLKEYLSRL